MTEFEQNVLLGISAIVLAGTLIVFVWQWLRGRGRHDGD
jgi:hypothetical protein